MKAFTILQFCLWIAWIIGILVLCIYTKKRTKLQELNRKDLALKVGREWNIKRSPELSQMRNHEFLLEYIDQ